MAVVWLPVDGKLLDAAPGFAAASWRREDLDAAWTAAGWFVPRSGSVAADVFDGLEQRQWTGDRLVAVGLNADCSSIVAVTIEVAYFVDPDEDDEEPMVTEERLAAGWSGLPDGTRADFDEAWRTDVATVAAHLGPPAATGMHDTEWHHAVWRAGDTLVALVQGENLDTYGFWDEAALWLVPHPATEPLLTGAELYDVMWGKPRETG